MQINLLTSPQIDGPSGFVGPCYCADSGYITGFFEVVPGTTVDFGKITIGSTEAFSHYYPYDTIPLFFGLTANTDLANPIADMNPTIGDFEFTFDLSHYVIAPGVTEIQFAWLGPNFYLAPSIAAAAPEPSTWAMLLFGFCGISLLRRIRSRTLARKFQESCCC